AFDDAGAGGDDGAGLLPLQHRLGDLGRVGQMADAGLDDTDAGLVQPLLDLLGQVPGNLRCVAAQGDAAVLVLVVGIAAGHGADGGFGLDVHEALVVVDVVDGLGRIHDPPDHHRGDLDRAAVQLVDLELARLEVAHAQADLAGGVEGVVPAQ